MEVAGEMKDTRSYESRKAYLKAWRDKNKTKWSQYGKKDYEDHKEARQEKNNKWFKEHREWDRERWLRRTPELEGKRRVRKIFKESHPKVQRRFYRHNYLTHEEYEAILPRLENGPCEICERTEDLVIDHDHAAKKFRGILCRMCNSGLGHFRDSVEWLTKAIEYLNRG